jgi:MSHA biogenesis protein MshP
MNAIADTTVMPCPPRRFRGFVLPSAIFLLVILAGLAAFMVTISQTMSTTSVQDVRGARAYQAARSGVEWGLYQVFDPTNSTVVAPGNPSWPNMPNCAAGTFAVEEFSVNVACTSYDYYESGSTRRIRVYQLVATASTGTVGTMGFIERQTEARVSKCRTEDGVPPKYECP